MNTLRLSRKEKNILQDLAKKYSEICNWEVQEERRALWRDHNSLIKTRPLVLCDWHDLSNLWLYQFEDQCICQDEYIRSLELWLRNKIFHSTVNDDFIFEPWITVDAVLETPIECKLDKKTGYLPIWGIYQEIIKDKNGGIGWRTVPALKDREDLDNLIAIDHKVDEKSTIHLVDQLTDVFGDIVPVNIDRSSCYKRYSGNDLSSAFGYLWGIEEFMIDFYERPELLHEFLTFMRDAVIKNFRQCEAAGDWKLANHLTTGQPYSHELPDPTANSSSVKMKDLWFFMHSQEFTLVSPEQTWEFMIEYQLPILEMFGLTAYGCCEDLTNKISLLRRISNLRQIGVTPWADLGKCVEQIEKDYVISWRPNPQLICVDYQPDLFAAEIKKGLEIGKESHIDIYFKDISTVEGNPERLVEITKIAKDLACEM